MLCKFAFSRASYWHTGAILQFRKLREISGILEFISGNLFLSCGNIECQTQMILSTVVFQMLLLQVWLHNEADFLKAPLDATTNLHSLLSALTFPSTPPTYNPLGGGLTQGEAESIHSVMCETSHVGGAEVAAVVVRSLVGGAVARRGESQDDMQVGNRASCMRSRVGLNYILYYILEWS